MARLVQRSRTRPQCGSADPTPTVRTAHRTQCPVKSARTLFPHSKKPFFFVKKKTIFEKNFFSEQTFLDTYIRLATTFIIIIFSPQKKYDDKFLSSLCMQKKFFFPLLLKIGYLELYFLMWACGCECGNPHSSNIKSTWGCGPHIIMRCALDR